MRIRRIATILAVSAALCAAPPLRAQSLNIDLGLQDNAPSSSFGAAASQPGTWSNLGVGTTLGLPDLTGAATAVSATVSAFSGYGTNPSGCGGDLALLIDDNIYTQNGSWTVTLSGLAPATYAVYLYGPSHPNVMTGNMTVNGTPVAILTGKGCTMTAGSTYATVSTAVPRGTLTITGDSTGTGYSFAGLAGLQLVLTAPLEAIPTASPAMLLLLAVLIAAAGSVLLRL